MRILSVILDPAVIDKILDHLASKGIEPGRGAADAAHAGGLPDLALSQRSNGPAGRPLAEPLS